MLKYIRKIFITGVLVLLPLITTIYIFYFLFDIIDSVTTPLVELIFGRDIAGIGLLITIAFIFASGVLATNIFGKRLINFGEKLLLKIPFFNSIYNSVKKIFDAIFSQRHTAFKKPLLFEYPRKGLYQIGFLTKKSPDYFDSISGERLLNVFLPTTPNPTSGYFIMIPEEDAVFLDFSVEDALKLIISGGIIDPEKLPIYEESIGESKGK